MPENMPDNSACPICTMTDLLDSGENLECVTCGHEWAEEPASEADSAEDEPSVTDANGKVLQTGDAVIVIKDLKVKGSSLTLKAGTKIKGIRIVEGDHDVDCKVDGIGVMLKSSLLKKA